MNPLNLWGYIREKTKQAVLGGINDALGEVEGNSPTDTSDAPLLLARLRPALPSSKANGHPADGKGRSVQPVRTRNRVAGD